MKVKKIFLPESEMPTQWYNIQADMPTPMEPPLHPGTGQPIGPEDLAPLFPMGLIAQEVSQERYIEIPDEVQDIYRIWRPTPASASKPCRSSHTPENPAAASVRSI